MFVFVFACMTRNGRVSTCLWFQRRTAEKSSRMIQHDAMGFFIAQSRGVVPKWSTTPIKKTSKHDAALCKTGNWRRWRCAVIGRQDRQNQMLRCDWLMTSSTWLLSSPNKGIHYQVSHRLIQSPNPDASLCHWSIKQRAEDKRDPDGVQRPISPKPHDARIEHRHDGTRMPILRTGLW